MLACACKVHKYILTHRKVKMVLCYQNCSKLLWEKNVLVIEKKLLKFEAEGQESAKILRSLEQFIQTVKGQNNFWWQNNVLLVLGGFSNQKIKIKQV